MNKKVISCDFTKEAKTQYGTVYNFKVKFEGDDKTYFYSAKDKENPFFKVGENADFDVETKTGTSEDGNPWTIHKLKPIRPNTFGGGGKGYAPREKSKKEVLCEHLSFNNRYVVDMIVAGIIKDTAWETQLNRMMEYVEKKINGYYSE